MVMPKVAFVSFRLGLSDGVSIVARCWQAAFIDLGWEPYEVAGEGPVDRLIGGLEIGATNPPEVSDLRVALADADLVVVENLLTIPMNLPASRAVARVLAGRPAILHHHDPPWQRERFSHITELPATDEAWRHVTINAFTQRQFADRGIAAATIYNGFQAGRPSQDRDETRRQLGVAPDELLFLHPVRAIERKNIGLATDITAAAGATYWLTGQAEEGYDAKLAEILNGARCRVVQQRFDSIDDAYAAADLVLFPSTWEGFGNPPIDAALRMKPVVVGDYPVAHELINMGFSWIEANQDLATIARIVQAARNPDRLELESNRRVAQEKLSMQKLTESVKNLLGEAGWIP